jgi:ATP-dependent helicase/nuclease subunit A
MTHSEPQADRSARERIQHDLAETLLVEAAAGTGKTRAIVGRMIALLREGMAEARNLAAITFTVKAAGELRRRFQTELEHAAVHEADELPRTRLGAALDAIDAVTIGTIHSFCATLLRERPVEAGLAPGFTVLEETEAASVRDEAWRNFVGNLPSTHPHSMQLIEEVDLDIETLEESFRTLCQWPDAAFDGGRTDEPDVSEAVQSISSLIDTVLPSITAAYGNEDGLQKALLRAASMLREPRSFLRDVRIISCFIPADAAQVTLKYWSDKAEAKVLKEELFPRLLRSMLRPAFARVQIYRYSLLLPLLRDAAAGYAELKRARNAVDNNDLLLAARKLLRDHPGTRGMFARRFTRVLVDEFQDTDPVQAEMLAWLCGDGEPGCAWKDLRLRPGALFLVGDPKQSIYRFRRADITVYNDMRGIVTASGGAVLELSRNFRSDAEICHVVNSVFGSAFPKTADAMQAHHVALEPTRDAAGTLRGVLNFRLAYDGNTKSDATHTATAQLSNWIASAIAAKATVSERNGSGARALRPSDLLILARTNDALPSLAAALDEAGVPFTVAGGIPAGDTDEFALLLILLRVLADPEDETAVVAWLRSAWCGVDDAALHAWREAGGAFKLTTRFLPGMDERIERGLLFIKNSMRLVRSAPPGAVISAMASEYGMLAALYGQDSGSMRAGVFSALLAMIRTQSAAGKSLIDIAALLENAAAMRGRYGVGSGGKITLAASLDPDTDAVRISTIHKAKGLEAPVVVVFTPTSFLTDHKPGIVIDRSGGSSTGWLQIWTGNGAAQVIAVPAGWEAMQARERDFIRAENQRLRYVAMTRARDCLIVMPPAKGEGLFTEAEFVALKLQDCPAYDSAITLQSGTDPDIDAKAFQQVLKEKRSALALPGYARYSTGSISKAGTLPRSADGHGATFGTVAHEVLRSAVQAPGIDLLPLTTELARQYRLGSGDVALITDMIAHAREHALWERIMKARRRLTEVPFGLPWQNDDGLPGTLRGDIDLAFLDDSGWTLVDYKTDVTGERLDELVAYYSPQLRVYRDAWRKLTGSDARGLLWFLEPNMVIDVLE